MSPTVGSARWMARASMAAAWPRVVGRCGQYRRGSVAQPLVSPAAWMPSMALTAASGVSAVSAKTPSISSTAARWPKAAVSITAASALLTAASSSENPGATSSTPRGGEGWAPLMWAAARYSQTAISARLIGSAGQNRSSPQPASIPSLATRSIPWA